MHATHTVVWHERLLTGLVLSSRAQLLGAQIIGAVRV